MLTLFRLFFACLTAIGYKPMIYQDFNNCSKQSEEQIIEVYDRKIKSNLYSDFGYIIAGYDDLVTPYFIKGMVDIYPSASIIYEGLYSGFTFSVGGDIFTESKLVNWQNINASTDFGYSTGTSITDVTYKYLRTTTNGFNKVLDWELYVNNVRILVFSLNRYDTSSFNSLGFATNIFEIYDGTLKYIVTPDSQSNNFANVFFNSSNNQYYQRGVTDGYLRGRDDGYQVGYSDGIVYSGEQSSTALTIFTGILEVGLLPVNVFLKFFEYEVFGINIAGLISGVVTVALIMILIRFIFGGKENGQ